MTIDEELNALDDALRRLKVEYDVFFGGGSKKPPTDLDWRVQSLLKKHSDSQKLSFVQRFKYNSMAQRYAIFSELWRQKLRIREEGYRRPEDALLSIQGLRTDEERAAARALKAEGERTEGEVREFTIGCDEIETGHEKVRLLFDAMLEARRSAGDATASGRFEGFLAFIKMKAEQIQREFHCHNVEFRVERTDHKVRLTARAKV